MTGFREDEDDPFEALKYEDAKVVVEDEDGYGLAEVAAALTTGVPEAEEEEAEAFLSLALAT